MFLHIGEPKTGTTFLQQVMWPNRAELAAQGVVLPGHHGQDHPLGRQLAAVAPHDLLQEGRAGLRLTDMQEDPG